LEKGSGELQNLNVFKFVDHCAEYDPSLYKYDPSGFNGFSGFQSYRHYQVACKEYHDRNYKSDKRKKKFNEVYEDLMKKFEV